MSMRGAKFGRLEHQPDSSAPPGDDPVMAGVTSIDTFQGHRAGLKRHERIEYLVFVENYQDQNARASGKFLFLYALIMMQNPR